MPGIARKDAVDQVQSPDGTGLGCNSPLLSYTEAGSKNVFINGVGAVREGDAMQIHPGPGCGLHTPELVSFSPNVFANGLRVGRLGDFYIAPGSREHPIISASTNVFAN